MLSDSDIREAIRTGELVVTPFEDSLIRPAGLSLRLGAEILIPQPGGTIDLRDETVSALNYESIQLEGDDRYVLEPAGFVLSHTYEQVTVSRRLGFLIEGRSTLARLGVTVVQTAMIVDTGHSERPITLELSNVGPRPVALYPLMPIARAVIFRLSSEASRGYDEYARYASQNAGAGRPLLS